MDLGEVDIVQRAKIVTGIGEFDEVVGGGMVPGSLVLFGGDPGIGKSTLALQLSMNLSTRKSCLYVSGEESVNQIKLRAGTVRQ